MTDFVFTQIFKAHKWLWIADSFSRHQLEHQKLRKRPDKTWLDHEEVHADRFRFLLPFILSKGDLNTKHRCEHDELLERLVDIENTYNVFKRSIDFDVKLGNSLKHVLVKPRKPGPRRDLLSEEQYVDVANIISSIDEWEDELDVRRQSFWNQWRFKLRESLAHLVCVIMRRVCCDASVALRMSSV